MLLGFREGAGGAGITLQAQIYQPLELRVELFGSVRIELTVTGPPYGMHLRATVVSTSSRVGNNYKSHSRRYSLFLFSESGLHVLHRMS
jgi:hypothetical protein